MKAPRYPNYFEQVSQNRSYFKHLEKLETIKTKKHVLTNNHTSLIDSVRSMRAQSIKFDKTERNHVIQKDNEILLEHIVKIGIRDSTRGISGLSNLRKSESPARSKKVYMKKVEEERVKAENAKFAQRLLQVDINTNREWEGKMLMHQKLKNDLKKLLDGGASQRHRLIGRASSTSKRDLTKGVRLPPLGRDSYAHAASFTHDLNDSRDKSESKTPNLVLNDSGLSELSPAKAEEPEQKDSVVEEKEKEKENEQS